MYALHASPWPLKQHVWISRRGMCFWAGQSCMCNKWSVKSVRRKAKHMHYVERVRECERIFEPHKTWRYGRLSRRPRALFASLSAAVSLILIVLDADFMALRLHLRSVFSSVFVPGSSSFFSAPNLCHFDVVTMRPLSAATALRINLRKCTQLFVNRMF